MSSLAACLISVLHRHLRLRGDMTGGGVRKKSGIHKLLVLLLFFACAIVALLVRGNGC